RPRRRAGQRGGAAGATQRGHRREVAQEQRGATHRVQAGAGDRGDRLQHEPRGDARAQLSADDPVQEVPLLLACAGGQLGQARLPRGGGGASAGGRAPGARRAPAPRASARAATAPATPPGVGGAPPLAGTSRGKPRTPSTRGSEVGNGWPVRKATASSTSVGS